MQRNIGALTSSEHDLLVVGGGIFGACAAWDAAQRGLNVALVERADFAGATSANSFRIVHGGIRYLQHMDLTRVRKSSRERSTLLRIAPHLVHPLPIVVPTYRGWLRGKGLLRVATAIYDRITSDRNRGILDPDRSIPVSRQLGRDELLRLFPGIDKRGLTGGGLFFDAQVYNPTRLVLAFVRAAAETGAAAANYVEVVGWLRDGDKIRGVAARDTLSGDELEIRAKVVLNATGPYAETLLRQGLRLDLTPPGTYSRDAALVVSRRWPDTSMGLAVQGSTQDPDAMVSRGERHLFVVPWRDYSLVGVWHTVYEGEPDDFAVTQAEIETFLEEINRACPALSLTRSDVRTVNAGLVPFGVNPEGAVDLRYGHRSRLVDHARTDGIEGLLTLIGVRYTMGRHEAARAVDLVFKKLGVPAPRCRTEETTLPGGGIASVAGLIEEVAAAQAGRLEAAVVESLVHNYGSAVRDVLASAGDEPELLGTIGASTTVKAEIVYAAREEMAMMLSDVVFRRTDLGTAEPPTLEQLQTCAALMGKQRDWDAARQAREIATISRDRKT